jgi:beta-glucosidase
MTTNEFACFTDLSYRSWTVCARDSGCPRPRLTKCAIMEFWRTGWACEAIRANAPAAQVGLAENAIVCVPVIEDRENIEAARRATRDLNAPFLTTLLEGRLSR